MDDLTLTIHSAGGSREHTMKGERLIIGRADGAAASSRVGPALLVEDGGLAARHASINREGGRVWVLDEGSTGGTFLNGQRVPPQGSALSDGDEISAGDHTIIVVRLRALSVAREQASDGRTPHVRSETNRHDPPSVLALVAAASCVVALVVVALAFLGGRDAGGRRDGAARAAEETGARPNDIGPPHDDGADVRGEPANVAGRPEGGAKLYLQMSREEQLLFLEERAQHVSTRMGNRPYAFNDEVIGQIKQYVDVYARRVGNNSRRMWREDLRFVFARARTLYTPHIIRAFNARGVPPVVGLYIVMIETEYHNIQRQNFAGAAGLFQFVGGTARLYGVEPSERTNIEKMAPAAAHYMSDRIAEFGPDSMSVALAIAGYNRSPDSVRRDLRDVLDSSNRERSFWTLVANSDRLDRWFRNENIKYVPKFFAAAIVGENPEAFGLVGMRKLSTYTTPGAAPPSDQGGALPDEAAP